MSLSDEAGRWLRGEMSADDYFAWAGEEARRTVDAELARRKMQRRAARRPSWRSRLARWLS